MNNKIGYVPNARVKAASPLQTLSSKRNWDRLQIKGSVKQLEHQLYQLPLDSKMAGRYMRVLAEMQKNLLLAVDSCWRREKALVRKAVEAEFLDYPPKGEKK